MKNMVLRPPYLVGILLVLMILPGCRKKAPPPVVEAPVVEAPPPPPPPPPPGPSAEEIERMRKEFETAVAEMIQFDFDKYDIKPEYRDVLSNKASLLREEKWQSVMVSIEGHCDEWGTNEYNLALGERRANAARDFLTSAGVDASRLTTVSYGEERPMDPAHTREAWGKNRRCEFHITSW